MYRSPAKVNMHWTGKKPDPASSKDPWRIYNIGNNQPINLLKYINALEKALGIKAKKIFASTTWRCFKYLCKHKELI